MALNFLKRKNTVQLNILLNHNHRNPLTRHLINAPSQIRRNIPRDDRQSEPILNDSQPPKSLSPELPKGNVELLTDETIEPSKWEKVAQHIEKLLFEISGSDSSGDCSRDRNETITEMINHKDSSSKPVKGKKHSEKNRWPEQESSKLPLDIQELKTVSEMAKRLSAHSKIKNHSISGE